jgi:hypothetical protein
MENSIPFKDKLKELLHNNKFAILLEVALVFIPSGALYIINTRTGSEFIHLGGNVVLLGGPFFLLRSDL